MDTEQLPRVINKRVLGSGNFIRLHELEYMDKDNQLRTYESTERTTRTEGGIDGVFVITNLRKKTDSFLDGKLILVSQFRPPLNRWTLEFPAGLVDSGEDGPTAAVRELKEETGYVGVVTNVKPVVSLDGGMSTANIQHVEVFVDADLPANDNPVNSPEDGEGEIKVYTIPLRDCEQSLIKLAKENNCIMNTTLLAYCSGLSMVSTL